MTSYPRPVRRALRIFPFDPMVDRFGGTVTADVPNEALEPGPSGRLVQVIDYDASRKCFYEPIDLDHPSVLVGRGMDPLEFDPRFHQQMVYAVAMRVLETFERGLGRPFRWRCQDCRLRIYPHAFERANAYFDPELFALLFGYFTADKDEPGANIPGQTVFTCLSHDIIAHETTHAIIHRLRRDYQNPTNPDVFGFHEGFSDIIAILQHFTYPEVVAKHVQSTRTELTDSEALLGLASQYGYAHGRGAPLRTALTEPRPTDYGNAFDSHRLGEVLAAAVLDGFLRSYRQTIGEPIRLATAGTGVLQPGALHPDLVSAVSSAVARTARRILNICIRAFDYLPPVDITFSDYLRALVTADTEMYPDDTSHLRANLIEGFRVRGIYPQDVASLGERSLLINRAVGADELPCTDELINAASRELAFRRSWHEAIQAPETSRSAGTDRAGWGRPDEAAVWERKLLDWALKHTTVLGLDPKDAPINVTGFHASQRPDRDGYVRVMVHAQFRQQLGRSAPRFGGIIPMGGATVIADGLGQVQYIVSKPLPVRGSETEKRLADFVNAVEHRTPALAWDRDSRDRIKARLNLRSLDARRF